MVSCSVCPHRAFTDTPVTTISSDSDTAAPCQGPTTTPRSHITRNGPTAFLEGPSQNGGLRDKGEVFQATPWHMTSGEEGLASCQRSGPRDPLRQAPPPYANGSPHDPSHQAPPSAGSHDNHYQLLVQYGSTHGSGLPQPIGGQYHLSPNNPFNLDYNTSNTTNTFSSVNHKPSHLTRMDGSASKAINFDDLHAVKAFPVFFDGNWAPSWKPLPVPLIKDAKKAIMYYALGSAFAMGVLNSLFQAFVFTPNDLKDLACTLLNNIQITMFLDQWLANVRKYAHETVGNTERPVPQTIDMLFGTGPYAFNAVQMHILVPVLITTKTLAFQDLQNIAEASQVTPPFQSIFQGRMSPSCSLQSA
ncbi:hypothetical protein WISP_82116 [Willisornis vidua]|uniref:Uncharacterized protein n=1 Tax=Willisornis vidua TaxID=1566151 RepID=A0ABQ9D8Z6_9PASS|nr:hypothetical protein WISP_82116 [Willisornis vidua]